VKIPRKMIVIAVVVSLIVSLSPQILRMGAQGYMWNLFMHVFGAILFMGNIMVAAVWASLAKRDGKTDTVRFASRGIALTDVIFTAPGAILLLVNGGIIGTPYFQASASWLFVSVGLFALAAVVWLAVLVPLQKRMLRLSEGIEIPEEWYDVMKKWFRWGGVAALLVLATLVLMVVKPLFW
jgi:uncharacterized membrane protein